MSGLISIAFGVVLFARPDMGAVTLALLFGLFNLVYGIWRSCRASSCAGRQDACTSLREKIAA